MIHKNHEKHVFFIFLKVVRWGQKTEKNVCYYGHSNNRGEGNNSVGWKKKVKLIIALVGNVSNDNIGWISTNFIIYII